MVEWKKLKDVCLKTNNIKWKTEPNDKVYKYIDLSSVNIETKKIENTLEICKKNAPSRAQQIVKHGDVLLGTTRPTLRRYCQVSPKYDNQICSSGFCVYRVNKEELLDRWLFHNISDNRFWNYCEYKQQGAGYPCLSNNDAFEYTIPVPPLSEQLKIVQILDTFTSSLENIKLQIAERRKQYAYYRDQLLDLEGKEGVEMKTLGEVCIKTQNIKWRTESVDKYYNYIDLSSVNIDLNIITDTTEINKENAPSRAQQIVKTGDILLGTTRPTLKRYCLVPSQYDNHICSTGYCIFRAKREIVLNRWIFHNIGNRKFWDYCEQHQQGAGYPCLSNTDAFAFCIPLPSINEQSRIVSILDTFEASIANLEAQLKQREKQYEYYRNKLLTF